MPPKFFITHSWNDLEFAKRFTDTMRQAGLDGFFDAYSLRPGDIVTAEIQRGLEACDVYVPVLSHAALRSPWCEEEINAAITLSKLPGRNGRPRIIPVLVEPCQDQMPIFLRARLYVVFTERYQEAFAEFWRGVTATPVAETTPAPPPPQPPPVSKTPEPAAPPVGKSAPHAQVSPPIAFPALPQLPRDELVHLYHEGRALQNAGDLTGARAAFQKVFSSAPDYRDVASRLTKLDLYLNASELMQQGLTDPEDKPGYWEQALARWQELVRLDANFLDARTKLQVAQRGMALPELYEKLLDALDADDWAAAMPLFEQIRRVKPTYLKTQLLFDRAWSEFVRAGLTKKINERDGKELMLVGAGEFLMGSTDADKDARANEEPQHLVYLDAFYISRYPVTNAEYKKFVDATQARAPQHWQNGEIPNGKENHPVVNVNWDEAAAYCKWAGGRLPREAEWEKAASWDEGKKMKRAYPWDDTFGASKCNSKESGIGDTTPVGKYSPRGDSFYGVSDMVGNVWEWCADWYDENYYASSPRENPEGAVSGPYHVLRGGSFYHGASDVRCAWRVRYVPRNFDWLIGFRVVVAPV